MIVVADTSLLNYLIRLGRATPHIQLDDVADLVNEKCTRGKHSQAGG